MSSYKVAHVITEIKSSPFSGSFQPNFQAARGAPAPLSGSVSEYALLLCPHQRHVSPPFPAGLRPLPSSGAQVFSVCRAAQPFCTLWCMKHSWLLNHIGTTAFCPWLPQMLVLTYDLLLSHSQQSQSVAQLSILHVPLT